MVSEFMVRGFEQKLMELYENFKRMGNLSQITYHKLQRNNKRLNIFFKKGREVMGNGLQVTDYILHITARRA